MLCFRRALVALVCLISGSAAAQDYPRKPVHMIVPFAAGGNVDITARIIGEQLAQSLHQPFVVENKPGAGGMIAGDTVARAAPDGYMLYVGSNSGLVISPLIYAKPLYDPRAVFTAVTSFSFTPTLLVAGPALKASNVKEFVDAARQKPGGLTVTVDTVGSINHIGSELLQSVIGVKWRNVHYRGNVEGVTDMLAGNVDAAVTQITAVSQYVQEGKVKVLAVLGKERVKSLPNVPTIGEAGYPGVEASAFNGLVAPAKTPKAIVTMLSDGVKAALAKPEVQAKFAAMGVEARAATPEEFERYLQEQSATLTPVIKAAGIKAE